jgi:membrane fusion protein (multidrug efflux system)
VRHASLVAVGILVAAAGCRRREPPPPPPPEVETTPVVQKDVPVVSEWIATVDGSVNAGIRPKVEGYLLHQLYKEGQFVHAGDRLFEIDQRQFRAALQQAQGALGQAEAQLSKTKKDVERFTPLAADRAISQQELDNALSAERAAEAAHAAAVAAVEQTQLNLGWTHVTSPIEGIVGIAKSQVGDLVNTQTVMTTVSTVDPIRVSFGISEKEYFRFAKQINRPNYATTQQGPYLDLVLDDGTVFAQKGRAVLVDREVDPGTGTMTIRGFFPNPGNILRPGQYGRVRAALDTKAGALLVPQRAVTEVQGAFRVAVVDAQGKVDVRAVEPAERVAGLWVMDKGVKPGEQVVVSGLQYVRPGMTVKAKPVPPPSAEPSPGASASPAPAPSASPSASPSR